MSPRYYMPTLGAMDTDPEFPDHGLAEHGLAGVDAEPADWSTYGITNFGAYSGQYGISGGFGLLAEVEPITADGLARTPMLELSLGDYLHVAQHGTPRPGCLAFGDDGTVYQWTPGPQGIGGFFSSLWSGIKHAAGSVVKGVTGLAKGVISKAISIGRSLISKIPGVGPYLVKILEKVHAVAMKLVRPLMRFVGPIARRLAPIAALVPGYGPALSAALYNTGKITEIMDAFSVHVDHGGKIHFKHPHAIPHFHKALHHAFQHARRTGLVHRPGVLHKGTPAHRAKLAQMGVQMPPQGYWQPPPWMMYGRAPATFMQQQQPPQQFGPMTWGMPQFRAQA